MKLTDVTATLITSITLVVVSVFGTLLASANAEEKQASANVQTSTTVELARHDFPYKSHYVEVKGAKMHYVDTGGKGSTIVMIHGQPTWSYLWRNIIPHLEDKHRVIALDLIGFGKSDKPDISYKAPEHAEYLQGFMEQLNLKDITLVIHDWGSILGFNYAATNPDNVKAIAFMEAAVAVPPIQPPYGMQKPKLDAQGPSTVEQFGQILSQIKTPGVGEKMILEDNFFLEQLTLAGFVGWLTEDEMNAYREPFSEGKNRMPMLQFPRDVPIDGKTPKYTVDMMAKYNTYLRTRKDLPKLLLHLDKGFVTQRWAVEWMRQNLSDITIHNMGEGSHFMQEHNPDGIGTAIAMWMDANKL